MRYSLAHQTMPGTRRVNQDRVGCAERDNSALLVVADGLGGYSGGELASQTLVDTFMTAFESVHQTDILEPGAFLVLTIAHAHSMIHRRAPEGGFNIGQPKTTCVACLIQNGYAYWGHVGDSRLYLFRDGRCVVRTEDHSTAQELCDAGVITDDHLRTMNSQLLRCVGASHRPSVTLGAETLLHNNDTLLLCSDGVWRGLTDDQLAEYTAYEKLDEAVVDLLIHAERDAQPDCDNISAVLFRWDDGLTTSPPLYDFQTPKLDQSRIWQSATSKLDDSTPDRCDGAQPNPPKSIESSIQEIESFIDGIDERLSNR